MIKIVRRRKPILTEPYEMYLGSVDVNGIPFAYASDPTLCGVFVGGRCSPCAGMFQRQTDSMETSSRWLPTLCKFTGVWSDN